MTNFSTPSGAESHHSLIAGAGSTESHDTARRRQLLRCPVCGYELRALAAAAHASTDGNREQPTPDVTSLHCEATHCGVRLRIADDGAVSVDALRLLKNSSMCVLAFSFPEAPGQSPWQQLENSQRWRRKSFSLSDPDDVDRTEYFLPYIRRFLFPSLFEGNGRRGRSSNEPPTCEHYKFVLERLGPAVGDRLPVDVTCDDVRKDQRYRYHLSFESIELILFSYRCGFLVLKFRHPAMDATLFDQMNALVFLRHIAPQHRGFRLPEMSAGGRAFTMPQLLSYLLQEFSATPHPPVNPADVASPPVLPVQPIYDDRMMIYSFSCLDRDSCMEQIDSNRSLVSRVPVIPVEPESGARGADLKEESLDSWKRIRWAGHSKDGGVLIAFNTDSFHEKFLGVYHETYYFDVFLLAALQRVTLITLFDRLSDIGSLTTGSRESHRLLRKVRYDLLRFTNQCCFSQITNREKGQDLSRKWQAVFENRTLMAEVHEQSGQLDTYLRNRTSQQVETLVRMGGFVATAVPAVLGLDVLFGNASWVDNVKWGLLVALITGTGLFAWIRLYRQAREV